MSTRKLGVIALACCMLVIASTAASGEAVPPPGDPAAAAAIILRQGTESVSLADVDAYLERNVPEIDRPGFLRSGERILTMIGNILLTKQLASEARAMGMDRDPLLAEQLGNGSDDEVLAKLRMDRFVDTLEIPDFDELAHERYRADPARFIERGGTDIRQIVVSTNGRGEEAARELAGELHAKAVADPDRFADLIAEYSDDPNKAETLGVMEEMENPRYTSQLREAALALQDVGDVSPPVRTSLGFQILQLIRRTPDRQKPFVEVRDEIVERLRTDWITKRKDAHISELRNLPVRDVDEDLLLSVQTRYGTLLDPESKAGEQAGPGVLSGSGLQRKPGAAEAARSPG